MEKKEELLCEHDENGFCEYYRMWCPQSQNTAFEECKRAKKIKRK